MTRASNSELTERQREILRRVVEEYVEKGQPVGSKNLVARAGMTVSPSTVRGDLAELERRGLLTHPHTSAGRVPTERGYRVYADSLLERLEPRPSPFPLDLEVLELLRPAFTELTGGLEQQLFVGGAASLLGEVRADELEACQRLLETLEKRAAILEMLGETIGSRRPYVRVGGELDNPALRELSLVGASYGLANRTLGAVSLL